MKKKKLTLTKRTRPAPKNEVDELKNKLGDFAAIDAFSVSEGGQIIMSNLMDDIVSTIDALTMKYRSDPTAVIPLCAELKANLDLLRVLTRAKRNKQVTRDLLTEALKEVPQE